ncbi:MAG: DNRLRE domain-containing protein [Ignavibacteriales bacterium]|nr:DNRLRE domain-containing protein [Ignavibacteriales bacterium]
MKAIKFIIVVLILALFYSCDEDPTAVGDGLTRPNLEIKKIDSFADSLIQTSISYLDTLQLGNATRLLLGRHKGIESSFLIKFFPFEPTMPDSVKNAVKDKNLVVTSAWIEFHTGYIFGDSNSVLDFSGFRVTQDWLFSKVTRYNINDIQYAEDIITNTQFTDSTFTIYLNNESVLKWIECAYDTSLKENHGLYFKASTNTDKILGFNAFIPELLSIEEYAAKFPKLKIIYQKPGSFTDTVTVTSVSDVHVVEGSIPTASPDNIYVMGGIPTRTSLKFDLSTLPKYAGIHKATLELNVDSITTKNGSPTSNSIAVELFESNSQRKVYKSFETLELKRDGNKFAGDITRFVQRWANGLKNEGIRLSLYDEFISAAIIALKGSNAVESLRPKITIIYSENK